MECVFTPNRKVMIYLMSVVASKLIPTNDRRCNFDEETVRKLPTEDNQYVKQSLFKCIQINGYNMPA